MNEVDQDRDRDAAGRGLVLDLLDLVVVPVGQRDPGPGTGGVAASGLVEQRGDGLGGPAGDIGGEGYSSDRTCQQRLACEGPISAI